MNESALKGAERLVLLILVLTLQFLVLFLKALVVLAHLLFLGRGDEVDTSADGCARGANDRARRSDDEAARKRGKRCETSENHDWSGHWSVLRCGPRPF